MSGSADISGDRVLLAAVTGAHGVSGRVRLKTFTEDPTTVGDYGPLSDEPGTRSFRVRVTGATKGGVIAELDGVRKREEAEALRGTALYALREALPDLDDPDDFYHADLIGMVVETREGQRLGSVRAIYDFGAGDVLDVKPSKGKAFLLPFTQDVVPEIDIPSGRLVVNLPDEVEVHDAQEVEETDTDSADATAEEASTEEDA